MRNLRHKLVDLLGQQGPKAFRGREIREKGGRKMFKVERRVRKHSLRQVCVCITVQPVWVKNHNLHSNGFRGSATFSRKWYF